MPRPVDLRSDTVTKPSDAMRRAMAEAAEALEPEPLCVDVVDLLEVENTQQVGGGTPWDIDDLHAVRKVAGERGVPLYMDGARVFNASAATGTSVADYAAQTDALMFCL